jgi:putative oxidoreductase
MKYLFYTNNITGYIFIRIILGYVFLVAGLQKFIFPEDMGPGRFMEIGFPYPEFTAYFVGSFEVLGGLMVLLGLATRFAAFPLFVTMLVAIITTKFPQLDEGFWAFAHAARLDISMLFTSLFVMFNGADKRSLDHHISKN